MDRSPPRVVQPEETSMPVKDSIPDRPGPGRRPDVTQTEDQAIATPIRTRQLVDLTRSGPERPR
jgi:hypothetical protein